MSDIATGNPGSAGFSPEWEARYQAGTHVSVWPWTDVVAHVQRYAKPRDAFSTVLELGCGAGANVPFFASRGDQYYALDGSATVVAGLHERFPELAHRILVADFTREIPFDAMFDLVVDRCSVTHNDTDSIERCLALVAARTRRGGLLVGVDWFTDEHSDAGKGIPVDSHTRRDIDSSTLHDLGCVHFSDRGHLEALLARAGFDVATLERKTVRMLTGSEGLVRDTFNFVAVRR